MRQAAMRSRFSLSRNDAASVAHLVREHGVFPEAMNGCVLAHDSQECLCRSIVALRAEAEGKQREDEEDGVAVIRDMITRSASDPVSAAKLQKLDARIAEHKLCTRPIVTCEDLLGTCRSFYLALQTPMQRAFLTEARPRCLHLDATHGLNQYKYPLVTLLAYCELSCTVIPVAQLVSKTTTTDDIARFLRLVINAVPNWIPLRVMHDDDAAEAAAVRAVARDYATIDGEDAIRSFLCGFHLRQSLTRYFQQLQKPSARVAHAVLPIYEKKKLMWRDSLMSPVECGRQFRTT
jgi:hypothetical protein